MGEKFEIKALTEWTFLDSNQGPFGYEPNALTCCAKCPIKKAPHKRDAFLGNYLSLRKTLPFGSFGPLFALRSTLQVKRLNYTFFNF